MASAAKKIHLDKLLCIILLFPISQTNGNNRFRYIISMNYAKSILPCFSSQNTGFDPTPTRPDIGSVKFIDSCELANVWRLVAGQIEGIALAPCIAITADGFMPSQAELDEVDPVRCREKLPGRRTGQATRCVFGPGPGIAIDIRDSKGAKRRKIIELPVLGIRSKTPKKRLPHSECIGSNGLPGPPCSPTLQHPSICPKIRLPGPPATYVNHLDESSECRCQTIIHLRPPHSHRD